MFLFKRNKVANEEVLSKMDGREVKYVTERKKKEDGSVKEIILGRTGRINVVSDEIRVMCGVKDVFICSIENSEYSMLMSGDGMTISGINTLTGEKANIVVYFTYYRK